MKRTYDFKNILNQYEFKNINELFDYLNGTNLSGTNLRDANLSWANLSWANLIGADIDFSCLSFSCSSLSAKYDKQHIIQILYHAAMPAQNNMLELDEDIIELFDSDLFKRVVNKFHRIGDDCDIFEGVIK